MSQRNRYDIVKGVLEIVYDSEPVYRNQMNHIMIGYEANLTHPQAVKYLRMLAELGLLVLTDFKPFPYYEMTQRGRRSLQLFSELEDDLRPVLPK